MSLLLLLIIAAILGSIGAALAGRRHNGCLASIALGFVGALLGQGLSTALDLPDIWTISLRRQSIPVFWTIIGSALFVALLNFISGANRR